MSCVMQTNVLLKIVARLVTIGLVHSERVCGFRLFRLYSNRLSRHQQLATR